MTTAKKTALRIVWTVGIVWLLAVILLAVGLIGPGMVVDHQIGESLCILGVVLAVAGVGLICVLLIAALVRLQEASESLVSDLRKLLAGQTQNEALLTNISENLLLSDKVKSIAFREKDKMVLIGAIEEDLRMEHWDSATMLIRELEEVFGSAQEAVGLRGDMKRLQNATLQEKIDAAIKHIESLWIIRHYADAEREIEALTRLHPQNDRVQALRGETQRRRDEHKKELLARWDQAVKNNDVDQGVELLKLLDEYLAPTEAAALQESARGVFRAKLHNLGIQFSLFVTERKWNQALSVGRKIIEDYPNSRMAQEVRDKMDILQEKAKE